MSQDPATRSFDLPKTTASKPSPAKRLLRLGLGGCLGLLVLMTLCGGLGAWGYRAGVNQGAEAAATIAATQAVAGPLPSTTARCDPPPAGPRGETAHRLTYGDLERRYITYVPETLDPSQPAPLVVSLHGSGASPSQQRDISQWNVFADAHGFIVVYPEAAEQANRTFVSFPTQNIVPELPEETALFDVVFIRDVLAAVSADHCINPGRVYINGFSAGGAMALFLACRLPGTFAAAGTVSAPYWADFDNPDWCPPGPAIPTVAFHGTDDRVIPYEGGGPPFGFDYVPYEVWTERWAARNGCAAAPARLAGGDVVSSRRFDCPERAAVVAYTIDGGGHAWPGGAPIMDAVLGQTTTEIAATAEMWAVFAAAGN